MPLAGRPKKGTTVRFHIKIVSVLFGIPSHLNQTLPGYGSFMRLSLVGDRGKSSEYRGLQRLIRNRGTLKSVAGL